MAKLPAAKAQDVFGQHPRQDRSVGGIRSPKEIGLKLGDQNELTIRRIKRGKSYPLFGPTARSIRDSRTSAVCIHDGGAPAYAEVAIRPIRIRICRRRPRMPRAGCNTAIIPIGKGPGAPQGPPPGAAGGGAAKKSGATSLSILSASCLREFALAAVIELIARTAIARAMNPMPVSTHPRRHHAF